MAGAGGAGESLSRKGDCGGEKQDEKPDSLGQLREKARRYLRHAGILAVGHAIARLCALALLAFIGRELGAEALGELALGQTLALYVKTGTDFGTCEIGARLVARRTQAAPAILRTIQSKRMLLTGIAVAIACLYAWKGPVPSSTRGVLFVFAISAASFGLSPEWLMWGLEKYGAIASFVVIIAGVYLLGAVIAVSVVARNPLIWVAMAYGLGLVAGVNLLWRLWWRQSVGGLPSAMKEQVRREVELETKWKVVGTLGSALLINQLFQSIDVMVMGALSSATEIGFYSAGRRLLITVFGIYYIVTQIAFPVMARAGRTRQRYRVLVWAIIGVTIAGSLIAVVLGMFASDILCAIYGQGLAGASRSLRVLSCTCPLEFATAMLAAMLMADGRNRVLLGAIGAGAIAELATTVCWVPAHGAVGAAWAKIVSYLVLLATMKILSGLEDRLRMEGHVVRDGGNVAPGAAVDSEP